MQPRRARGHRLAPEPGKRHRHASEGRRAVQGYDPGIRLEIAGDGPSRDELRRTAAELRLDGAVTFLGQVVDISCCSASAAVVLPLLSE